MLLQLKTYTNRYEKGEPIWVYTGRGPSSDNLHIGHIVPFELTKWVSDVFQAPVVIMLTDGMGMTPSMEHPSLD
jgi:tryptophanyl-tRNA synthetase